MTGIGVKCVFLLVLILCLWILLCLQTLVKTFEVCDLPVRVAKFVARKHWVIAGAVSLIKPLDASLYVMFLAGFWTTETCQKP